MTTKLHYGREQSPVLVWQLREAHHLFVEMGATGHAERIAQLLSESVR